MLLFETRNLCKYYRGGSRAEVRALDDVSLSIPRGSLTALAGPSGSGKTTLLALLGALERPTRGQVFFDAKELSDCSDAALARMRRRMGFVFQDFALIPNLSAEDNITYPLIPRGFSRSERQKRACEALSRLGMDDKLTSRTAELSGGEQQRIALARALAGDPEVILADEPTSSLDAETAQILQAIFKELHAAGKTIVLSSHDPAVICLATQVHQLQRGRLVV